MSRKKKIEELRVAVHVAERVADTAETYLRRALRELATSNPVAARAIEADARADGVLLEEADRG